jgi:hypothetical protein
MSVLQQMRLQAMAHAMAEAQRNSLAFRMPENVADDRVYNVIDISLKLWDVPNGLWEIAAMGKLALGASAAATVSTEAIAASEMAAQAAAASGGGKIASALTFSEAVAVAGPLVAYVGLWSVSVHLTSKPSRRSHAMPRAAVLPKAFWSAPMVGGLTGRGTSQCRRKWPSMTTGYPALKTLQTTLTAWVS